MGKNYTRQELGRKTKKKLIEIVLNQESVIQKALDRLDQKDTSDFVNLMMNAVAPEMDVYRFAKRQWTEKRANG
jgi:uncharacterized protein YjgD (DUF1641 family)